MKKRYLSILAPAAFALMITGCGKAADTATTVAESSTMQSESQTERLAKRSSLRLAMKIMFMQR